MPRFTQPPYLLEEVRVEYCDCTEPDPGILACEAPAVYRPRHPEETVFYQTFEQHFDKYVAAYEQRFEPRSGPLRHVVPEAVVQFLACGRLQGGFARLRCPSCKRTPGRVLMPHAELLRQLSGQTRRAVC